MTHHLEGKTLECSHWRKGAHGCQQLSTTRLRDTSSFTGEQPLGSKHREKPGLGEASWDKHFSWRHGGREGLSPGWQVLASPSCTLGIPFDSFLHKAFSKLLSRRHFLEFLFKAFTFTWNETEKHFLFKVKTAEMLIICHLLSNDLIKIIHVSIKKNKANVSKFKKKIK